MSAAPRSYGSAILLCGFDSFCDADPNPSSVLVTEAAAALAPRATSVVLPTSYRRAWPRLREAMISVRPAVVLLFGYHPEARGIRLETLATNEYRDARADNDGVVRSGKILPDGPREQLVTVPVDDLARRIADIGGLVEVSADAGGFVCNHTLYLALNEAYSFATPAVGFVHVGKWDPDGDLTAWATALVQGALPASLRSG